jgi:hypothetical protein
VGEVLFVGEEVLFVKEEVSFVGGEASLVEDALFEQKLAFGRTLVEGVALLLGLLGYCVLYPIYTALFPPYHIGQSILRE